MSLTSRLELGIRQRRIGSSHDEAIETRVGRQIGEAWPRGTVADEELGMPRFEKSSDRSPVPVNDEYCDCEYREERCLNQEVVHAAQRIGGSAASNSTDLQRQASAPATGTVPRIDSNDLFSVRCNRLLGGARMEGPITSWKRNGSRARIGPQSPCGAHPRVRLADRERSLRRGTCIPHGGDRRHRLRNRP